VVHAISGKELFVMSSCVIPRVEELISFVCEDRAKGDFKEDEWAAMKAASDDQLFVVIDVWHQYTLHNADLPEHHIATLSVLTAEEYDAEEDDEGSDDGGGSPRVSFLRPVKQEPTDSDHKPAQGAQDESAPIDPLFYNSSGSNAKH
jgi:hypothetical protein